MLKVDVDVDGDVWYQLNIYHLQYKTKKLCGTQFTRHIELRVLPDVDTTDNLDFFNIGFWPVHI